MSDQSSILSDLKSIADWEGCPDFAPETYDQVKVLPLAILKSIHDAQSDFIQRFNSTAKLEQDKKKLMPDWVEEQKSSETSVTKLGELLGATVTALAKTDKDTQEKTIVSVKVPIEFAKLFINLLEEKKTQLEERFAEEHKPKPKSSKKTSARRQKFNGEVVYNNTPETADGADNKFFFKGDEKSVFEKVTSTNDDTQKRSYKAVKSDRYLGGSESKPDDGFCCGVVTWDKAMGSDAIKETGLSTSQFKVRCGAKADGFCSKCDKKKISFFQHGYDITRGTGQKFNDQTYKSFITEFLEYA